MQIYDPGGSLVLGAEGSAMVGSVQPGARATAGLVPRPVLKHLVKFTRDRCRINLLVRCQRKQICIASEMDQVLFFIFKRKLKGYEHTRQDSNLRCNRKNNRGAGPAPA